MASLLSSPARLTNPTAIAAFKRWFIFHGGLGYRPADALAVNTAEHERLEVIPLVFGLLPSGTLNRPRHVSQVKPSIRQHLTQIGLDDTDETLVELLKRISDQYVRTAAKRYRKFGMADLRATPAMYRAVLERQHGRCNVCGVSFLNKGVAQTLDHAIPFRLIGDIRDGANWQVLCEFCNGGKGSVLASLQLAEAYNWVYGGNIPPWRLRRATRYLVLTQQAECSICRRTCHEAELHVTKVCAEGLPIADNLRVVCRTHADGHVIESP